ncbi:hypothetical protein Y958_29150 [Nitrospirillum viridazoti CBAmc]|uniref:Uncharacterized protein n=1 Tax=Nitrospirillum viridazoti CBAmc TaxID=1441467 RepID=A0A248K277_9PROT|nr:hypothetical protein Y958_29150 [Nitrospirillum amazonense CBAmc]
MANRWCQVDQIGAEALSRTPSARTIARLMTSGRDALTEAEAVVVAAIESGIHTISSCQRESSQRFAEL